MIPNSKKISKLWILFDEVQLIQQNNIRLIQKAL